MEDGDNGNTEVLSNTINNDDKHLCMLPDMANYPDIEVPVVKNKNAGEGNESKVNGEAENKADEGEDDDDSDDNALVIDEDRQTKVNAGRKRLLSPMKDEFKGFKKRMLRKSTETVKLVNECMNAVQLVDNITSEEICDKNDDLNQGELNNITQEATETPEDPLTNFNEENTTQNQTPNLNEENTIQNEPPDPKPQGASNKKLKVNGKKKKNPSPKQLKYAQYLGLQPAVKFKCYKCSESSFRTMTALTEHREKCQGQPQANPQPTNTTTSTNFRLTRKVFLCSACGTYYENWNLFLHMREVHRRFICLYCLGMFSLVEKLSQHLIAKHNCSPTQYQSPDELLNVSKESLVIMCCHCERVFTEQDNFYEHTCTERTTTSSDKPCWSCGSKGITPHLSACRASIELPVTNQNNQKTKNNSKKTKKPPFANIEHVTADSKPLSPNRQEQTCDIANLCTVDMEPTVKSEPPSPEKTPQERSPSYSEPDPESSTSKPTEGDDLQNEPDPSEETNQSDNNETNDQQRTESELEQTDLESSEMKELPKSPIEDDEIHMDEIHEEESTNRIIDTTEETNESVDSVKEADMSNNTEVSTESNNNDENNEEEPKTEEEMEIEPPVEEVRRVPKVTLKLPPPGTRFSDNESDDSEKLTMEVDDDSDQDDDTHDPDIENHDESLESFPKENTQLNGYAENESKFDENVDDSSPTDDIVIAGEDVGVIELQLEQPLDKFTTEDLLKTCLGATIPTCIYCNHARKIVVNGKQLGLHAIAEHRFAATVNSITAEELIPYNFVLRIKEGLEELDDVYFNLEPSEPEPPIDFKRIYECFQCRYVTTIHKDLYLHNRKMHAKTILLCIICKSNFYTYSELICHLCPGNYVLNNDMKFRCCLCETRDLPSAFRLMVHLRKKHHTCDVCLEACNNQSRLSNHVWKHKLHHLCYRCGIAYRNKPDITKHLFWKHGTESVLCKKCLQKKWPHVYHFCIPPPAFVCEECNLSFSRAVYLKVHKRLHNDEKKHKCTEKGCRDAFISKKLLMKHERRHREPSPVPEPLPDVNGDEKLEVEEKVEEKDVAEILEEKIEEKEVEKEEAPKPKNIIDVYDLPALNLSESDSDDSDEETPKLSEEMKKEDKLEEPSIEPLSMDLEMNEEQPLEEKQKELQIVDGIWENFKQYQATIEKRDILNIVDKKEENGEPVVEPVLEPVLEPDTNEAPESEIKPDIEVILADHDYCIVRAEGSNTDKEEKDKSMDHDYCTPTKNEEESVGVDNSVEKKVETVGKKKSSSSSDSSSDTDSSSCTCGSNCSCSSSSGSSSSSSSTSGSDTSSSEGKKRIAARRKRREERAKRKQKESETSQVASNTSAVDVVATEENAPLLPLIEVPIQESDLDTDETETDEDFYDEHPQKIVNKMLEEKRNQLMALAGIMPPVSNGSIVECSRPSTPSLPEETPVITPVAKKKIKSKKRKKKSRSSNTKQDIQPHIPVYQNHVPSPLAAPIQPITTINRPPVVPSPILPPVPPIIVPRHILETPKASTTGSGSENESNIRSSKRRRVPNKFYGYSSDDESAEKPPAPPILKWRKADLPTPTPAPKIVPPITIKNIPSPAPIIEPVHQPPVVHHTEVPDSDSEPEYNQPRKSSSDTSDSNRNDDSDSDTGQLHISQPPQYAPPMNVPPMMPAQRTNENLYCYCQCPYDEVSEMIACDGRECAIEWFHFECVGIMVPPKGKWFCPDCRKKATPMRNDFIPT